MTACFSPQASGHPRLLASGPGMLLSSRALAQSCRPTKSVGYQQLGLMLGSLKDELAPFAADDENLITRVKRSYVLVDESSVTDYLRSHRNLPPVLLEAVPAIERCFGSEAVTQLRVSVDSLGDQFLYAVVIWPGAAIEVRAALERFDNEWWLDHSELTSGYLTFTYELV